MEKLMDKHFRQSFDVINDIADEIGINREICQSAMTEALVNYKLVEEKKNELLQIGSSKKETIQKLCKIYFSELFKGVHLIWEKFPSETILVETKISLIKFANDNHLDLCESPKVEKTSSNETQESIYLKDEAKSIAFIGISLSYDRIAQSLELQCRMKAHNIEDVCKDKFSLGYIFGFVNMAYFQHGGDLEDGEKAMLCLVWVLKKLIPDKAKNLYLLSIDSQEDQRFIKGRVTGSNEYGALIKSKGAYTPMGLITS